MSARKAYVAPIIEYGIVDIAVDVMVIVVLRGYLVADAARNAGRGEEKEAATAEPANTG